MRRVTFISILLLITLLNLVAYGQDKVEIRVLPESVVYNQDYTLGEVAELDGFDLELIQKLSSIRVGRSPIPGRSHMIAGTTVRAKVRRYLKDSQYNLSVPPKPLVSRASLKIGAEQLKAAVTQEILTQYKDFDDVRITIKTRLRDIFIPKGDLTYSIKRIGKASKLGGYGSWMLRLKLNEAEVKRVLIRAKVEVIDDVVVAKDRITKGSLIEKADLTTIKQDISNQRPGFRAQPDLVVGKQATRDILSTEAIKPHLAEQPFVIHKGGPVRLVYKTKNMYLTNIAKALKNGRVGDIIPVRTMNSKKTIYAIIRDANLVEVAL